MRIRLLTRSLIVFGFLAVGVNTTCLATDSVQEIVHAVEGRYHSSRSLKAVFLERYTEGRQTVRVESGIVYFSHPGRMRWEYESPEEKLFLTDGKTVWFYVPSDHTVTRAPMKESDDWRTPLALLTGKSNLSRVCKRIELEDKPPDTPGNVTLRCWPTGAKTGTSTNNATQSLMNANQAPSLDQTAEIQEILLQVDPKEGWLTSVRIRQSGGVEIEYRFGKWESNVELPEAMFHFSAPKGVAIVEEGASGHLPQ
ncbi:MAG TPA: outer membrane lipoprotein carrier protein LolA [Candidatus Limnocylindrales bacterium]|nr:outer membrane lipoprotein carrier protein LolA [Candidatus Limnocylindrales bacterium]